jgi:hypothetical protein
MGQAKIYLADLTHCGTVTNADTFPYGIGCIASYAKQKFGDAITVDLFKLPHDLNAALNAAPPDVLCFSNYVWNYYLSSAFGRHVRQTWPHIPIVMGGSSRRTRGSTST